MAQLRARPSNGHPDASLLGHFQLMESCYSAFEELHFPYPPGFHTKFAILGFHALARQYASKCAPAHHQ